MKASETVMARKRKIFVWKIEIESSKLLNLATFTVLLVFYFMKYKLISCLFFSHLPHSEAYKREFIRIYEKISGTGVTIFVHKCFCFLSVPESKKGAFDLHNFRPMLHDTPVVQTTGLKHLLNSSRNPCLVKDGRWLNFSFLDEKTWDMLATYHGVHVYKLHFLHRFNQIGSKYKPNAYLIFR
jgi:hypothetical protein